MGFADRSTLIGVEMWTFLAKHAGVVQSKYEAALCEESAVAFSLPTVTSLLQILRLLFLGP